MLEQIRQSIEQAQMVLVGIGTEFAVKEEAQEDPFFTEARELQGIVAVNLTSEFGVWRSRSGTSICSWSLRTFPANAETLRPERSSTKNSLMWAFISFP